MYWSYFKYIVEHKINVGIECFKMGLFIHAITHDLSKFRPSEFFPYAKYFYCGKQNKKEFNDAWILHYERNKHHWNYWTYFYPDGNPLDGVDLKQEAIEMPLKYVLQMVADWRGMARKVGDSAQEYFNKNKKSMILHPITKERITKHLSE